MRYPARNENQREEDCMVPKAWIPRVVGGATLTLLLAGCGALPPATQDMVPGHTLEQDEVLVLGRLVKIGYDGDTTDYGEPREMTLILVGYTNVFAVHLMTADSLITGIPLRDDGTFLWHLKPGTYQLTGITSYVGTTYHHQFWARHGVFTIMPGDRAIYIGNLVYNESRARPSDLLSVIDDRQSALKSIAARYPGTSLNPESRLIEVR